MLIKYVSHTEITGVAYLLIFAHLCFFLQELALNIVPDSGTGVMCNVS